MKRTPYISTGISSLDNMLRGGLPKQNLILFYGEASTGKTTLAITTTFHHLNTDPACKVIYIDADNKLSHIRLQQIANHTEPNLLLRLHIHTPQTYSQQIQIIEELYPNLESGDLIIIDSITGLYRVEAGDETKTFSFNKELNRLLGYITEMALKKDTTFILTGQVRTVLDTFNIEPVAPRLLYYWSNTILKLEKTLKPNQRQITIEKPDRSPNTLYFSLSDKGAEDYL